jgi:hypothetical protein
VEATSRFEDNRPPTSQSQNPLAVVLCEHRPSVNNNNNSNSNSNNDHVRRRPMVM